MNNTNPCACDLPDGTPHDCSNERQEIAISFIDEGELIDVENEILMLKIAGLIVKDAIPADVIQLDTPHGAALTTAVYRAVDDLEGQGNRSQRIAFQLLEALAHYELALGEQVAPARDTLIRPPPMGTPAGDSEDPPCIVRGQE